MFFNKYIKELGKILGDKTKVNPILFCHFKHIHIYANNFASCQQCGVFVKKQHLCAWCSVDPKLLGLYGFVWLGFGVFLFVLTSRPKDSMDETCLY